jgi:hypothetical protein
VQYERAKIKKKKKISASDDFMSDFQDFEEEYGHLIKEKSIGAQPLISLQTPRMAALPLENYRDLLDELKENDPKPFPTYGIVTDAAHGFWKDGSAILIVSIEYSKDVLGWVPVYVSYARGQTAEVFASHFYGFFRSIHQQAIQLKLEVNKELFAGVCSIPCM